MWGCQSKEVPVALNAGHRPGDAGPTVRGYLQELFKSLVGGAGQCGQPAPGAPEVGPQPPGEGEDHVPVGHRLEDSPGDELPELDLPLLVAGGTEAAPLAGEGQEVLVFAGRAADAGEAPVQDAALPEGLDGVFLALPAFSAHAARYLG